MGRLPILAGVTVGMHDHAAGRRRPPSGEGYEEFISRTYGTRRRMGLPDDGGAFGDSRWQG